LISAMPRPRKPFLHRERNRHGKHVWYVRRGSGPRFRLRSEFGSEAFNAEYEAAIQGKLAQRGQAVAGTLTWLWDAYRKSDAWKALAPATRRQRENIMLHVTKLAGEIPFGAIRSDDIVAGLDKRAETPSAARNFLDTMRGLYQWAKARGYVRTDPTSNVKPPKRRRNSGFTPWTRDDVAKYQAKWQLGTPQRVWLDVLLYTGFRRGDAAIVGNRHVSEEGIISISTEKTGTPVIVPMLTVLQRSLLAGPRGKETWIVGTGGKSFVKESFGNLFSEAARAAGVPKSAHGVRKIAATIAAENGATESELDAIFGWTGGRMSAVYTKQANRARLAAQAIEKLKSIPAPLEKVRASAQNALANQPPTKQLVGEAEVQSPNDSNNMHEGEGE
jgi:integrase